MLQDLLVERFQLRLHSETREAPAYVLTVDKGGLKMRPSETAEQQFEQSPGEQPHHVRMKARGVDISYVAWRLGRVMDLPVVDRTNLKGTFDFDLEFVEEVPPQVQIDPRPSVFQAVQQRLGLRLDSRRAPVEFLVIDKVARPTLESPQ